MPSKVSEETEVSRRTKLPLCPTAQACVVLPIPILVRLNDLLDAAPLELGRIHRNELIGALALSLDIDAAAIEKIVREYRTATAGQAVASQRGPISIGTRQTGPRSRGRAP